MEQKFVRMYKDIMRMNRLEEFASDELAEKFEALTARMLEVNDHMNLTAIREIPDIIAKHYADSLMVAKHIPHKAKIIDIGCGAGFPSLPLAIARPDLNVTALDSTAKRVIYIEETVRLLKIYNVTTEVGRAEELARDPHYRERYDFAVARAVARLNILCELCLCYVKPGGVFAAMKADASDELGDAIDAIFMLGGKLEPQDRFKLVLGDGSEAAREIVLISKLKPAPRIFPRNNTLITKKPL